MALDQLHPFMFALYTDIQVFHDDAYHSAFLDNDDSDNMIMMMHVTAPADDVIGSL